MKRGTFLLSVSLLSFQIIVESGDFILNAAPAPESGARTERLNKPGWTLTFHDEFDASTLDTTKWNDRYISSAKLADPTLAQAHYLIEDGILYLRMDKTLPPGTTPEKKQGRVSSIETAEWLDPEGRNLRVHFAQKYGWFEIRSRMPGGSGLHSAFWLLLAKHIDWKKAKKERKVVEIDIFEQQGRKTAMHENECNVHFSADGHQKIDMGFDPSRHFHTYALEWSEGKLIWYVDGKIVRQYTGETPQSPMFVLLGLYEGSGWTGEVEPEIKYPRDFEIDYIRIYEKNHSTVR